MRFDKRIVLIAAVVLGATPALAGRVNGTINPQNHVQRVAHPDQARQADRSPVDERYTEPPAKHAEHGILFRNPAGDNGVRRKGPGSFQPGQ